MPHTVRPPVPWLACAGALLAPALALAFLPALAAATMIEGYVSRQSVAQGDPVSFHVSTDAARFDLEIFRQGASLSPMLEIDDIPGGVRATPDSAYWYGCGWPASCVLAVPAAWPSGVYLGKLTAGGAERWTIFAVREDEPGSTSPILLVLDDNTWQAYNAWGGKSLYNFNSGGRRSARVSFDRPYQGSGYGDFFLHGVAHFIQWAESEGTVLEYAANADLDRDPTLLSHYVVYLSVGHDEYWSYEMREQLEDFHARGGNLGFFSGNSIYWQVRFEDGERAMVCYKNAGLDPLFGTDNARVTVRWRDPPVVRPEAALIGVQYFPPAGCCCGEPLCRSQGQPAAVADPDHWMFANAGIALGDSLGTIILGWEWDQTAPGVTPPGAAIVLDAWPLNADGIPTLFQGTYYVDSGKVFAGGTVQWGLGLANDWGSGFADPDVQQVTRNILRELLTPVQPTGVAGQLATPPAGSRLRAWLGPSGSELEFEIVLPAPGRVVLTLHDVSGRFVERCLERTMAAGTHRLTAPLASRPGRRLPSGIYYLRSNLGGPGTKLAVVR